MRFKRPQQLSSAAVARVATTFAHDAQSLLNISCKCYWVKVIKENQMRSQDLEFHPKNRIFDLDRLTEVESKKLKQKLKKQSKSETSKSKIFPFEYPK